jgi:hypothetical protein
MAIFFSDFAQLERSFKTSIQAIGELDSFFSYPVSLVDEGG